MKKSGVIFGVLTSLWIVAIVVGMSVLMKYDYTPGIANTPVKHWPKNSQISLSADCPTLIMFAHPQCPCTRASIAELGVLTARCKKKFKSYVLLFNPKLTPAGWDRTALWRSAQTIPGATVLSDIDGVEAQRFHSTTSGQTMVYGPQGQLLFSGGITKARGQEGDNPGLNSAKLALLSSPLTISQTSIFGCSLVGSNK